jgi:hypothetical protein
MARVTAWEIGNPNKYTEKKNFREAEKRPKKRRGDGKKKIGFGSGGG